LLTGDCFLNQKVDQGATSNQYNVSQDLPLVGKLARDSPVSVSQVPPLVGEVARDSPMKQRNYWRCFECRSAFVDFNLFRLHVADHRSAADRSRLVDDGESPLQQNISGTTGSQAFAVSVAYGRLPPLFLDLKKSDALFSYTRIVNVYALNGLSESQTSHGQGHKNNNPAVWMQHTINQCELNSPFLRTKPS